MFGDDIKMALAAVRTTKWRSVLTMFGIVIGIVSVVTTVSLGEGVKQQVIGQMNQIGSDLITIRPGRSVERDSHGNIKKINLAQSYGLASGSLSDQDLRVVTETPGLKEVSPISLIDAGATAAGRNYDDGVVLGTSPDLPALLQQKIDYGVYFTKDEQDRHVAVIGKRVAEQLFHENVPIGMTLTIRGQDFIVRGVFAEFSNTPLNSGIDYNKTIFIPYQQSKQLAAGNTPIVQILARPVQPDMAKESISSINQRLTAAHGGVSDFTVLKQDENLMVTNDLLSILTATIAGIAAISLVVGGIGIMNIMLVSVTERTREIGIRKAIGATNRQIVSQFITEAIVLSITGGVLGIVLSILCNYLIRITTNLKPIVTLPVIGLATFVSVAVGIIFGIAPALKAAHKDPIEALRYE